MDAVGFGLEKFDAVGRAPGTIAAGISQDLGEEDDEDGQQPVQGIVTLPLDTQRVRCRHSEFGVLFAAATGRGAGEERAMPGVRREAVFPVSGRTNGYAGGSPADPDAVTTDFRNSGFRFKELIVSLMVLREFPRRDSTAKQPEQTRRIAEHVADNHESR